MVNKDKLIQWRNLTERNCHTEVLKEIAKYYDYKDLYNIFKSLEKMHNDIGHMPYELYSARLYLYGFLLGEIHNEFPEDYDAVKSCL